MSFPITDIDYRPDENYATAYSGKYAIATLNFNNGEFEEYEELTNEEYEECISEMTREKEEVDANDYDVAKEQDLYA